MPSRLFRAAPRDGRRKVLKILVQNCVWKDGALRVTLRQPFERFRVTTEKLKVLKAQGADEAKIHCVWYPLINDVCVVLRHPTARLRQMVIEAKAIAGAA